MNIVRMQVHATTGQLSYNGTLVELTDAISHLPAGGQTLLSNQTLQLVTSEFQKDSGTSRQTEEPKVNFPWRKIAMSSTLLKD